ncbi:MAG: DNA-3-methyladenine glycosylase family protein [Galactobacter sp.]
MTIPDARARFSPSGVVDLGATLAPLPHGPQDPTCVLVPDGLWRAVRLASGPAVVRVRGVRGEAVAARGGAAAAPSGVRLSDPRDRRSGGTTRGMLLDPARGDVVEALAWGPGADQAVAQAPLWVGEHDDWSGFDAPDFAATLPEFVATTRRARPGLRLPAAGSLMDTVAAVVLEQRVTGLEAHGAWKLLVREFGDVAPTVPGAPRALHLPPTGEAWQAVPSWRWHAARVDASRRNTIVNVARRTSAWERLERDVAPGTADSAGLARLETALRSIHGIGVWTAAETLQRTHGSPDHVSFGDFHVAHLVGQALTGRRTDDAGMARLLSPWHGHRQRVVRLIAASGAKNPSYGPRLAPHDHRGH